MKTNGDIEQLLSETPGPRVVVGPHRDYLKAKLLQSMQKENPTMMAKLTTWRTGLAACCIAMLLAAGGWAAYEGYFPYFVVEQEIGEPVVNPDGSVSQKVKTVVVGSNDPDMTQDDADQVHQQVKAAIAAGHYRLVKVQERESEPDIYVYAVTLEDGTITGHGTTEPLPESEDD